MNKRLLAFLAILAALGFLALCAVVAIPFFGGYSKGSLPSRILLEADFERPIEEYMPDQQRVAQIQLYLPVQRR